MPLAEPVVIGLAALLQLQVGRLVVFGGLVPDLILGVTVLLIARNPSRWWMYAAIAGALTMAWTVRLPMTALAGFIALGWLTRQAVGRWDLQDLVVCMVFVGLLEGLLRLSSLAAGGAWSVPMTTGVVLQTALTVAAIPFLRWLVERLPRSE